MLIGLPKIKRYNPDYAFFKSVNKAVSIVRKGIIAEAAGNNGAIDFYKDDDGNYQCRLHRNCVTEDSQIFKKQKDAAGWLKNNLHTIY